MSDDLLVRGATAPSGARYVHILQGEADAWIPESRFHYGAESPFSSISDQGVRVFDRADAEKLTRLVKAVQEFPSANIVERVGWNGDLYALADGTPLSPCPDDGFVAFRSSGLGCAASGSLKVWRKEVALPLGRHPLGALAMMFPFVPPVLRFLPEVKNFAVELVGKRGVGKTTLQILAASVVGRTAEGLGPTYWLRLHTTLNAVEDTIAAHADHPIIFDDSNHLDGGQGAKAMGEIYRALAFKLYGGGSKARKGDARVDTFRTAALISANESLGDLADASSRGTGAAADRLLTIRIPDNWQHGVYERLPKGFSDGVEFARSMLTAAHANHGVAYRRFIKRLVEELAAGEIGLKRRLERYQRRFLRKVGGSRNSGSDFRVAEIFATIYAAGKLAQSFGALPILPGGLASIVKCYRLHEAERVANKPFDERLRLLLLHPDVIHLAKGGRKTKKAVAKKAMATLWDTKRGSELRISSDKITTAFANWDRIRSSAEVRAYLRTESPGQHRHLQPKASLAPGMKKERLWCFAVPREWTARP